MSNTTINLTNTPKKYNYSEEDIVMLVLAYDVAKKEAEAMEDPQAAFLRREEVVNSFANRFNTTKASVRGKLVSEGVYVAKQYTSKRPYKASKEKMVTRLEELLQLEPGKLDSLEKVNKQCIEEIVHVMKLLQCGVIDADMAEFYDGL